MAIRLRPRFEWSAVQAWLEENDQPREEEEGLIPMMRGLTASFPPSGYFQENHDRAETRQIRLLGDQENQDYCLLRRFACKRCVFRSIQPRILDIEIAGLRPNFGFFFQYSD